MGACEKERKSEPTHYDWHDGPQEPLVLLHVASAAVVAVVDEAIHLLWHHCPWTCCAHNETCLLKPQLLRDKGKNDDHNSNEILVYRAIAKLKNLKQMV